jgi:protein involved in polysaccharide export with SLBB domain
MLSKSDVLVCVLLALPAGRAAAQLPDWDPLSRNATRESLQALLQRLDGAAQSPAYSPTLRAQATAEATKIQSRLTAGDFITGDRIMMVVEGEQMLSDTFAVTPGPELVVPNLGTIPLLGVLRAELEPHLTQQVARFIRNPKLRAGTLVRISVEGGVERPGFYTVPTEIVLTDALQLAGGLGRTAKLNDVVIQREAEVLWDGPALLQAITLGRTLDELGVRAGDRIVVGEQGEGISGFYNSARSVSLILALPAAVVGLIALLSGGRGR